MAGRASPSRADAAVDNSLTLRGVPDDALAPLVGPLVGLPVLLVLPVLVAVGCGGWALLDWLADYLMANTP
jgi:hypothetical protein